MAPFGEKLADFFNDFVGADAMSPPAPAEKRSFCYQGFEVCRVAIKTASQYVSLTCRVEEFENSVDEFARATNPADLGKRSLLALRDDLRRFREIRCYRWTNASLADAAAMIGYGLLKALLRSAYPHAGDAALHNNLLKGLGGVVSVQPAIELWKLSRKILADPEMASWVARSDSRDIVSALETEPQREWLRKEVNAYLQRWGFRFSGELMLTLPSFQEDPLPLLDMLKTYLKAEDDAPIDALRQLESKQAAATARIMEDLKRTKRIRGLPRYLQAPIVRFALQATQRSIKLRERARSKQALLYTRCRRIALAIGDRLVASGVLQASDDIFFLTWPELDEFLSGHAMFPNLLSETVALHKRAFEAEANFVAPDTFSWSEGAYRDAENPPSARPDSKHGMDLSGISACGGQVTARAAVLGSLTDAHQLHVGDILVTRQTDPGWAPVFSLIRGLVIERGGMLSHGAIIAREFGLPCIVAVKDASTTIPHGCMLSMDGDRGHVRILD
jgi:pyruvate,water dikinase